MRIIPLQTLPNQNFSLQIDDNTYDLRLHDCGGITAVSIDFNNTPVLSGARAVSGFPIIPYAYLEATIGNFMFINAQTDLGEYPDWPRFNADQILLYATPQEIEGINFIDFIEGVLRGTRT